MSVELEEFYTLRCYKEMAFPKYVGQIELVFDLFEQLLRVPVN